MVSGVGSGVGRGGLSAGRGERWEEKSGICRYGFMNDCNDGMKRTNVDEIGWDERDEKVHGSGRKTHI